MDNSEKSSLTKLKLPYLPLQLELSIGHSQCKCQKENVKVILSIIASLIKVVFYSCCLYISDTRNVRFQTLGTWRNNRTEHPHESI